MEKVNGVFILVLKKINFKYQPAIPLIAMAYENLDARLLNRLLKDGRASLRSLGEDLDVSVTTISNHLEQLEEDGVIEGFTPRIDYSKLGYEVQCVINLKVEGSELVEFTERLKDHSNMVSVYETTGDYDVIAIGRYTSTEAMNDQIKGLLQDSAVTQSNTSVVLNAVKDNEQFEIPFDEE